MTTHGMVKTKQTKTKILNNLVQLSDIFELLYFIKVFLPSWSVNDMPVMDGRAMSSNVCPFIYMLNW